MICLPAKLHMMQIPHNKLSATIIITSILCFTPLQCMSQSSEGTSVESSEEIIIDPPREVERWFAALGGANQREFGALIAEDAKIILKDLGIEQTKDEFISALDEWIRLTKNASIVYRYEMIEDEKAATLVCYRFENNEQLNLESFTFQNKQITGSVQELKGEDCGEM